jgi:ankyrin repeat protein
LILAPQAASFGHSDAATALIKLGSDGTLTDAALRTVLHRVKDATCCGLIAAKFPVLIDRVDIDYLSPLHYAASEGNSAVVKVLLSLGADPTGTGPPPLRNLNFFVLMMRCRRV